MEASHEPNPNRQLPNLWRPGRMERRQHVPAILFGPLQTDRPGRLASEEHKIPVSPDAEDEMFSEDFDPRH